MQRPDFGRIYSETLRAQGRDESPFGSRTVRQVAAHLRRQAMEARDGNPATDVVALVTECLQAMIMWDETLPNVGMDALEAMVHGAIQGKTLEGVEPHIEEVADIMRDHLLAGRGRLGDDARIVALARCRGLATVAASQRLGPSRSWWCAALVEAEIEAEGPFVVGLFGLAAGGNPWYTGPRGAEQETTVASLASVLAVPQAPDSAGRPPVAWCRALAAAVIPDGFRITEPVEVTGPVGSLLLTSLDDAVVVPIPDLAAPIAS